MKIIFETNKKRCEVSNDNVKYMDEMVDLIVQALRGWGFSDENIAETMLFKSKEMNNGKINLVV